MRGDLPPITDIPAGLLNGIDGLAYTRADLVDTERFLSPSDGSERISLSRALSVDGLVFATRLRLHDFGDATTVDGASIETKKQDPIWLGVEAVSHMMQQNGVADAE